MSTYVLILLVLALPTTRVSAINEVAFEPESIPDTFPLVEIPEEAISEEPLAQETEILEEVAVSTTPTIPVVPFYSQFDDITPPEWKKISCGIASLAMLIDYYDTAVLPDTLLKEGIKAGAYIEDAGWSHDGLIGLAKDHGLTGEPVPLAHLSIEDAFSELEAAVLEGPVIVSVHYTFDPKNPIPHLVVVTGVADGLVHYNDPAEEVGGGTVSITQFKTAWKKRYISIRPLS